MTRDKKIELIVSLACILLTGCGISPPISPRSATATPAPALERVASPVPAATISPLPRDAMPPSSVPTSTAAAGTGAYEMRSWSLFSRTRVDSTQQVFVRFTRDGEGIAGAEMYVLVRFQERTYRYPEQGTRTTDGKGVTSVEFPVADAHPDEVVLVDVYVTYDGTPYHSAVLFTANC